MDDLDFTDAELAEFAIRLMLWDGEADHGVIAGAEQLDDIRQ